MGSAERPATSGWSASESVGCRPGPPHGGHEPPRLGPLGGGSPAAFLRVTERFHASLVQPSILQRDVDTGANDEGSAVMTEGQGATEPLLDAVGAAHERPVRGEEP
jgi:hypothetical protein